YWSYDVCSSDLYSLGGVAYGTNSLASHTYSRSGTFFVVLSATNGTGVYSTASHVLVVGSGVVAADFVYPSYNIVVGTVYPGSGSPVVFNATVTGGTSPYTFSWDFGDGLTATGSTVTHTFSTGGTFTVVLTVTDAGAAHAVASRFVLVQSVPRIDFVSYPIVTAGSPTVFNATTPGLYAYYWDVRNGTYLNAGVECVTNGLSSFTNYRSGTFF